MRNKFAALIFIITFITSCMQGQNNQSLSVKEKPFFEVRAFISDIEHAKKTLSFLNATFKGEYAFMDYIYHSKDRDYDLNKEFVRLRIYQKTHWDQKMVEFSHKLKNNQGSGLKFKMQFDSLEEAEAVLSDYKFAFSFKRRGFEYELGYMRIFIEEIQGLPPSVEIVSSKKDDLDQLFENLAPVQILSDSVPRLIENKLNGGEAIKYETSLEMPRLIFSSKEGMQDGYTYQLFLQEGEAFHDFFYRKLVP